MSAEWGCPNCERQNTGRVKTCVHCGLDRAALPAPATEKACQDCGLAVQRWADLRADEHNRRLCDRCWDRWSIAHAGRPEAACTEPGCTKTAADHIAECAIIVATIGDPKPWTDADDAPDHPLAFVRRRAQQPASKSLRNA